MPSSRKSSGQTDSHGLTSNPGSPSPTASPPEGSFSSSTPGTPWHNRSHNTSFSHPLSQTQSHGSQSPGGGLRSRASSLSERLRLDRIFKPSDRKQKRNKLVRDKSARPSRPDVLDKEDTHKLTKFWNSVGSVENESDYYQTKSPPSVAARPDLPDIFEFLEESLEGLIDLPQIEIEERRPVKQTPFSEQRAVMDPSRLAPESSLDGEKKQKAIQDARDMQHHISRKCERHNLTVPPYDFIELIGKGAFGRVYKCRKRQTGDLVAIKIVNTDDIDYSSDTLDKDDTIRDFRKEVSILQQLRDNNAKNVNMIHDAFDLHEQLWIVSDYCTGGSIKTLMRALPGMQLPMSELYGLDEQYIIPIARELAIAIQSVHGIGVIHRDIKCTNVYVTEEGQIQLGDFGIVGVMDDGGSKRRTMIGTPNYMPREMLQTGGGNQVLEGYGTEVDIWSFGCTVYEMATGLPPNAKLGHDFQALNKELLNAPRLQGGKFSQDLRDFIAFCLNSDPQDRPTADEVLRHSYIANTEKKYPTRRLIELIHKYKVWEYGGGWRSSLFMPGGAPPVAGSAQDSAQADEDEDFDDWNFSTSDSFNAAFEKRYSQMAFAQPSGGLRLDTSGTGLPPIQTQDLSAFERLQQEIKASSANRGERSLDRLWKPDSAPYELHTPLLDPPPLVSDLPFRNLASAGTSRESQVIIDLDSAGTDDDVPSLNFDFGDIPTLKAKSTRQPSQFGEEEEDDFQYGQAEEGPGPGNRATMEWKFPTAKRATMDWSFPSREPAEPDDPDKGMRLPGPGDQDDLPPGFRPKLKHTATEPVGNFMHQMHPSPQMGAMSGSPVRDSMRSMIDLDFGFDESLELERPSTAISNADSTMTDMTSGNPFDLEDDPKQNEMDRNRFSYHKQWQSEGGPIKRSSRNSVIMHTRGSSLSSTATDLERLSGSDDDVYRYEYNHKVSESMRRQLNSEFTDDSVDLNAWPDFGPHQHGFDREKSYNDPLDDMIARQSALDVTRPQQPRPSNGNGIRRPSGASIDGPKLEFPRIVGPHPDALLEDADPQTMILEMNRMLNGFEDGLRVTARALQEHTGVDASDESGFESASGVESSGLTTGDEDGF